MKMRPFVVAIEVDTKSRLYCKTISSFLSASKTTKNREIACLVPEEGSSPLLSSTSFLFKTNFHSISKKCNEMLKNVGKCK